MFINVLKLLLIVGPVLLFLVGGGYYTSDEALLFGLMLSLVFLAIVYWLPDKIVLKMCRAELLTIYHSPTLFKLVEEQSLKAGVPMPKIYAIAGEAPNAFATGRSPWHSAIAFTDGILREVSTAELRNIISHELAHIKRGETLVASITAVIASIVGFGMSAHDAVDDDENAGHSTFRRAAKRGFRYVLAPLPALVVTSLINRKREFRADADAARITGDPKNMASAIRVMEKRKNVVPLLVSPAVAHLFTVSPLTVGRMARLFQTHPPMEIRIQRLEALVVERPVSTAVQRL